jgi:hypothetical protein
VQRRAGLANGNGRAYRFTLHLMCVDGSFSNNKIKGAAIFQVPKFSDNNILDNHLVQLKGQLIRDNLYFFL